MEAPWRAFVPDEEFERRVELTKSLCVVDGEHFFIRGHIDIPIIDHSESLIFSVWSSLSEKSFRHVNERWNAMDRLNDSLYFGWLCSPISVYANALELPLSVQTREVGLVPLFRIRDCNHPLAIDQEGGISKKRWHEIAMKLMEELGE